MEHLESKTKILIKNRGNDVSEKQSFGFDIEIFFSNTCFNGFEESNPKNFFSVYSEVFKNILVEEEDARLGDIERESNVPSYLTGENFGDVNTPLEQVERFYIYWESFSTCKTFAWADVYRHEKEHNRYIRRLIDQDNAKSRQKAKKKYLDKIK